MRGQPIASRPAHLQHGRIAIPSITTISLDKLARLVDTPKCPFLIDVQTEEDFAADPRLIPGSVRRPWQAVADWAHEFSSRSAVVICQNGQKLSKGVAARLWHEGIPADFLEGGALAWAGASRGS
ncbi:rhodanese-like domain-containing protein [Microvirga vignae]|uniref:rhodanese-like domain-containing protein n=1 Tax=Microvirga vignae TaxID=1225564 RepID=UPI0006999EEC